TTSPTATKPTSTAYVPPISANGNQQDTLLASGSGPKAKKEPLTSKLVLSTLSKEQQQLQHLSGELTTPATPDSSDTVTKVSVSSSVSISSTSLKLKPKVAGLSTTAGV